MLKTTMIAACVLAVSGSLALAQTNAPYNSPGGIMPPDGANNAPYGANGAAPMRDIGTPSANSTTTATGGTSSTSMLSQGKKNQSAAGMPSSNYGGMQGGQSAGTQYGYGPQQAYGGMNGDQNASPNGVCITDEYGHKYNCRGDRIGGRRR